MVILLQRKPVELNSVQNPLAGGGHLEGSIEREDEKSSYQLLINHLHAAVVCPCCSIFSG